jgi:hypothetical protein
MASIWDYLSNIPDVAKSFGTGLVNAGTELAGTPGNLRHIDAWPYVARGTCGSHRSSRGARIR